METMTYSPLLPPEMIEEILDHLDSSSLHHMRMTSKQIQGVVDQPKYLKKIPVYVTDDQALTEFLNSTTATSPPWSNFKIGRVFSRGFRQHFLNSSLFVDVFTPQFGSGITSCSLSRLEVPHDATYLFAGMTNLESLHIEQLRDRRIYGSNPDEDVMNRIEENFRGLKHLSIGSVNIWNTYYNLLKNPYSFHALLKMCPNLVTLTLPVFLRSKIRQEFIGPLLEYLRAREDRREDASDNIGRIESFTISLKNYYPPENFRAIGYSPYSICYGHYTDLVNHCFHSQAKLTFVPYYIFPKEFVDLCPCFARRLNQVVSSVVIDPKRTPVNWKEAFHVPDNHIVEHYTRPNPH